MDDRGGAAHGHAVALPRPEVEATGRWALREMARRAALGVGLSLPVVIFVLPFAVLDRNAPMAGDWGYFLQLYEAARRSILDFHQFPWWNPWNLGGIPLYANPQFGLISVQMPLVLVFGTLPGLRLAVAVYLLLGFWGMSRLLGRLGSGPVLATLLGYAWSLGSFPVLHLYAGHLTFGTYLLVPWFLLALMDIGRRHAWLRLGLLTALLVNQAPHNVTVQMLVLGALLAGYQLLHRDVEQPWGRRLRPYLLSGLVAVPLVAHKLFHTLRYMGDFPRPTPEDPATSVPLVWAGLTRPPWVDARGEYGAAYGWHEYGAFIGLSTLVLFAVAAVRALARRGRLEPRDALVLGAVGVTLLLALGSFAPWSPYALLHRLPLFDQMRVPSRWLGWMVLAMVVFLARLPRVRWAYALAAVGALEVFVVHQPVLDSAEGTYRAPPEQPGFVQFERFPSDQPVDMRMFAATQANAGVLYGYEPIVGFYPDDDDAFLDPLTDRCGVTAGCGLVLSANAAVAEWTPHRIVLRRTGPGPVELNMNPGRGWSVNGRAAFRDLRVFELTEAFVIDDPSATLVVTRRG